jgi:hypothetical protein
MAMIEVRATQSSPGGARASRLRRGPGSAGLVVLLFLLAGCRDAAAQEEGVVLEVTTTTAEEMFPLEAAIGEKLGPHGTEAVLIALMKVGKDLKKLGVPSADVLDAVNQAQSGLTGKKPPALSSMDYTVYLRDDLMAVAAKGMPVMVWEVTGSGKSAMWFLDPSTGRPIAIPGTNTTGISLAGMDDPGAGAASGATVSKPIATGATREILGHTAHEYRYRVDLRQAPTDVAYPGGMLIRLTIEGEAWVAPESPYRAEVATFYRNFAAGVGSPGGAGVEGAGHVSGLTAHMAAIAELGVPLATSESVTTYLVGGDDITPMGIPLSKAATSSTVTSIRRAPIDDEQYYGKEGKPGAPAAGAAGQSPAAPERPACDCSCEAYAKLQELSKKSKEEQAADPTAMATAMCASQCAMKWIGCKR